MVSAVPGERWVIDGLSTQHERNIEVFRDGSSSLALVAKYMMNKGFCKRRRSRSF
jgi:hypothetical protein